MNTEEFKSEVKDVVNSKFFKRVMYTIGFLFILFLVFQAGQFTGLKRAMFRCNWSDNYEENFGPMRRDIREMKIMSFDDLPNSHGVIGKIIKNDYPKIIVLDRDNTEKVVLLKDDTEILNRREKVSKESLLVDTHIIVIGNANTDGQIESKLIRIIPSPGGMIGANIRWEDGPNGQNLEINNR